MLLKQKEQKELLQMQKEDKVPKEEEKKEV